MVLRGVSGLGFNSNPTISLIYQKEKAATHQYTVIESACSPSASDGLGVLGCRRSAEVEDVP